MKKVMIGVLVSSLLAATTPLYAESAGVTEPSLSPEGVRSSIARAIVLADADAQAPLPAQHPLSVSVRRQFASTSAASPEAAGAAQVGAAAGGGGGHALATILTLVGTAVSVGGMVYYMKVLKKATSQPPTN
jgi:hypothetical protein